jgi:hypothetical protein
LRRSVWRVFGGPYAGCMLAVVCAWRVLAKSLATHQLAGEGVVDDDPFDVADRIWELSGRADGVSVW